MPQNAKMRKDISKAIKLKMELWLTRNQHFHTEFAHLAEASFTFEGVDGKVKRRQAQRPHRTYEVGCIAGRQWTCRIKTNEQTWNTWMFW
jgi:DNA-binding GntR family transcriptional regulator